MYVYTDRNIKFYIYIYICIEIYDGDAPVFLTHSWDAHPIILKRGLSSSCATLKPCPGARGNEHLRIEGGCSKLFPL